MHIPPTEDRFPKVPREAEAEESYLGQFIPVHYHHNMLMDENRMSAFKAAIDYAVFVGAKVLSWAGGRGCYRAWLPRVRAKCGASNSILTWLQSRAACWR